MDSSTSEDGDANSSKDLIQTDNTQKEESFNVTLPYYYPTQTKASSTDKSEKGNNPE